MEVFESLLRSCGVIWRKMKLTGPPHAAAIERLISDLEQLNRSTEKDFLSVGEKLMEFRSAARQVFSDMNALTELISGTEGQKVLRALEGILEQSAAIRDGIESNVARLAGVRQLAGQLRQVFSDASSHVAIFRSLCTLTRIETALLGKTTEGFMDLAAEVAPLAENLRVSGKEVLAEASRLDRGVEVAIAGASVLCDRQLRELPALIEAVTARMNSFTMRQQRAYEASRRQTSEYEVLSVAIDDLVRSIQFHDITRQQIEHIVQALRQVAGGASDADTVLALQIFQLGNARQVFSSAAAGIARDLEGIAVRFRNVADCSRELLGVSEEDHSSFFRQMEADFGGIEDAMSGCCEALAAMQMTAEQIADLVNRMKKAIDTIRDLEIRIQRIAINAAIRAAHIGKAGDALVVIADNMQHTVNVSSSRSEDSVAGLDAIRDSAGVLAGETAGGALAEAALAEIRGATAALHATGEASFSRTNQLMDVGMRLATQIGALRDGFCAGAVFVEEMDRCISSLQEIVSQIHGSAPGGASLGDIEEQYTMQMERDVHQRALQGDAAAPVAADTLGGNIELF